MKPFFVAICVSFTLSITLINAEENQKQTLPFSTKNWNVYVNKQAKEAGCKSEFVDEKLVVTSTSYEKQGAFNIQLIGNIKLDSGKKYKLTFDITSNKSGSIPVSYALKSAPFTVYAGMDMKISDKIQKYLCFFHLKPSAQDSDTPKCIRLAVGGFGDAKLVFSNCIIEEAK